MKPWHWFVVVPLGVALLIADGFASFFNFMMAAMSHDSDAAAGTFHFGIVDSFLVAQIGAWIVVLISPFLPKVPAILRLLMFAAPMLTSVALWVVIDIGARLERGG